MQCHVCTISSLKFISYNIFTIYTILQVQTQLWHMPVCSLAEKLCVGEGTKRKDGVLLCFSSVVKESNWHG